MDTLDTKRMEMFIRVQENRQEFAQAALADSYGAELFEQLGQGIEDLRARSYDQSRGQSSVRESFASMAATRDELVQQLDAIYQTARVLVVKRPELEDKFRSPRGLGGEALLTLARTYGNDAFPLKAELVKRGLGTDFIADLDAAAVAFNTARNERAQGRGRQVEATAEIDRLVDLGLQLVRELRVLVLNIYDNDPAKLALWVSASHIERPPRRSRRKNNSNPPPPPTQD